MKRGWPIVGLSTVLLLVGILVIEPLFVDASDVSWVRDPWQGLSVIAMALGLGIVGSLLASHRPDQPIGWLMLAYGVVFSAQLVIEETLLVVFRNGQSFGTGLMVTALNVLSAISLGLLATLMVVFPSGEPASPRWRSALVVVWSATALGAMLSPFSAYQYGANGSTVEIPSLVSVPIASDIGFAVVLPVFVVMLAAGIRIVTLLFRGTPVERRQVMWVAFTLALVAIALVFAFWVPAAATIAGLVAGIGVPVSIGIAIMRYRLYEIDVVVSRALTLGVLAVFITGVYAVVVVGVGSLVGGGEDSGLALSIVAVTVVAVVFEPVRRRVQHWANVVVYGRRATPYEVLASATTRLAEARDPDDALTQLTGLIGGGTGASVVVVWLVVGDRMVPRSAMPDGVLEGLVPVALSEDVAVLPGDLVVPVRHGGEVLGALSISKARGDVVSGSDERVVGDVAAGAGVLLRNMGLNAELVERADQLRVSRRRLVAAHDAERHRLERDLHDGAQQQVVALKVKLGIARTLAEREGAGRVAGLVGSLAETTQEAVDGMRAIAHGIYPPLLETEGLVAALGASARTVRVPVEVVATGVGRYDRAVEEGVYFAVLDTVNRAVDAGASRAVVSLTGTEDVVGFTIDVDATPRDLIAVEDRIDALDGTLTTTADTTVSTRHVITVTLPTHTQTMEPA